MKFIVHNSSTSSNVTGAILGTKSVDVLAGSTFSFLSAL